MNLSLKNISNPFGLYLMMLLALVNGLLFIFIVPPWQHYDEPNHFEYAWWLANREGIPGPDDVDTEMRRQVAASMLDHQFYDQLGFQPDLTAQGKEIWIGEYSQVNDPPLYYGIVSLPLRIFAGADIATQLYTGRVVSLLFFLLTILAAFGIATDLTPNQHPLRFLLPLTLAFLPGFVDLMTALNNDVGLVLFFSWFLWGLIRLVRRGFNPLDFLWAAAAAFLAILTKQTGLLALPILAIGVFFSLLKGKMRKFAWVLLGVFALVGVSAVFTWGQPAFWYIRAEQNNPVRSERMLPPHGEYEFYLAAPAGKRIGKILQILPLDTSRNLAGKTITLGAWIWADRPVEIQGPAITIFGSNRRISQIVSVTTEPTFFALSTKLPRNMQRGGVVVEPFDRPVQEPVSIYVDGLVLVEGDFSQSPPPVFIDDLSHKGIWGASPFENLVRNGSGEQAWIGLRAWIDRLGPKIYPDYGQEGLSLAFYTLRDRTAAGWFYSNSIGQLGRTFWGRFGWGNIDLIGQKPYRPLAVLTGLGLFGAILAAIRAGKKLRWEIVFLLGAAIGIVWGATLFRGSSFILDRAHFLPVARYVFPVIIPTLMVLVIGWLELMNWIGRLSASLRPWLFGVYLLIFFGIDLYALFSIFRYFAV
jgi:hypothetical protein